MVLTVDPARFADVDRGDRLTFTATLADGSPLPGWLVFDPASLTFRGTPPQEAAGTLSLALRATDMAGASASLGVTVSIVAEVQRGDTPAPAPTTPPDVAPTTPTTGGDPSNPGTGTLITGPGYGTPGTPGGLTTGFPGGTVTSISPGLGGDGMGAGAVNAAGLLRLGNGDLSTSALFQQYSQANVELFLAGSVGNQTLLPMQQATFQVPKNIFRHTNPNERLVYQAVRPDGSPLPNWLQFDAQNLAFRGAPPATARGALDIVIVAKDSRGNQAAAQFRVLVTQDLNTQTLIANGRGQQPAQAEGPPEGQGDGQGEGQTPDREPDQRPLQIPGRDINPPEAQNQPNVLLPKEQRADAGVPDSMEGADAWMTAGIRAGAPADAAPAAGRASFTAQLHAAGRPGLLAEARALLNTLLQSDDRNAA